MIARFRCGAESRGTEAWRILDWCKMSGVERETMQHMTDCIGEGWNRWRFICAEDVKGMHWIENGWEMRIAGIKYIGAAFLHYHGLIVVL